WWVALVVALSPALTLLFAVAPMSYLNLDLVALVWRRIWRSVRLSRPSARRAWQERYGHLQTLNAWDLWGATDFTGTTSDRDEALRRERVDQARARRRPGTWRHRLEDR
ncbi:hypothetical protein, partial [Aquipuribacter sp. MA13-13]|uniref:hypothetical protein n=1 Tax=Aquipuribacter sp. MA13-13 TaxID=3440840 RepID=UPI003EEC37DF